MKRSNIIILVVLGVIVLWAIVVRNGLAGTQVELNGKWGEVETQYQRKAKLYENLIATVKGAARNEDTTLIKIVQMRSRIADVKPDQNNPEQLAQANKQYSDIGRAIMNINVEAYPTLKATELFGNLQAQVEGTENRVAVAIRDWNTVVTNYNGKVVRFPNNLIAGMLGYTQKQNFKADEGAKDTKIDFGK